MKSKSLWMVCMGLIGVLLVGATPLWCADGSALPKENNGAVKRPAGLAKEVNPGSLEILQLGGQKSEGKLELPLERTDVQIEVSGFVARATVTQRYRNPYKKPIEAVYTFPLPEDAAVDDMRMTIGERIIQGVIKKRDEARKIYEEARDRGQHASLLEQERPNIFTQSVANILPGEDIVVTIRYVGILDYSEGAYELVFPMVVGPRYIPGDIATGQQGTGGSPDTDAVPDASRITPPVLRPGQRSGHDIALNVELDAGVPIRGLHSISHVIDANEHSAQRRSIRLHPSDTIPNKDFVLRYEVAGEAPELAVLPHHDERGGFFTLLVQPQRRVDDAQVVPRELIFIVDTSGSMRGFPIEKSKEAMRKLIGGMRPSDTFNVVRFAGDTGTLWAQPKAYSGETADEALRYVEGLRGSGGTEMRKGIIEALGRPASEGRLRIAFLLTDGYIGNEDQIFRAIEQERRGARVFSLGVGSSVNRYLLDRVARVGLGEAFYVRQDEDSEEVIEKFFRRVDRPSLAHVEIDWKGLDVSDLYPSRIPDLWAGQPIRIHGRYLRGGKAEIEVRGQLGAKPYRQRVAVNLPRPMPEHEAIASVWARQRVAELMSRMVREGQTDQLVDAVTSTGLEFRLMTQWTSFVAVEEKVVNVDGKPQTVVQPVELPEGVSYDGVFGELRDEGQTRKMQAPAAPSRFVSPSPLVSRESARAVAPLTLMAEKSAEPLPKAEPVENRPRDGGDRQSQVDAVAPTCRIEAVSVSGALKFPQVKKRIDEVREELCRTIEQHPTVKARLQGRVPLSLVLGADGKVSELRVEGVTEESAKGFYAALRRVLGSWTLGAPGKVGFTLRW